MRHPFSQDSLAFPSAARSSFSQDVHTHTSFPLQDPFSQDSLTFTSITQDLSHKECLAHSLGSLHSQLSPVRFAFSPDLSDLSVQQHSCNVKTVIKTLMKATPFSQELLATMLSQILSYLFLPQPPFSQEKQTSKTFSHQATSQLHHQETFHTNCRLLVREDLFCFCIASVVHCFLLFFAPTRSSITQCSSGCTCHGLRR